AWASTPRPQSCRYLQETLSKLSADCVRAGSPTPREHSPESIGQSSPSRLGQDSSSRLSHFEASRPGSTLPTLAPGRVSGIPSGLSDTQLPQSPRGCTPSLLSNWPRGAPQAPMRDIEQFREVIQDEVRATFEGGAVMGFLDGWTAQLI
ncbi:unnamed protein product, partial [Polarella glacialis]